MGVELPRCCTMETKDKYSEKLYEEGHEVPFQRFFDSKVVRFCICTMFLCSLLLNVNFIIGNFKANKTGGFNEEMTLNPSKISQAVEFYKKEMKHQKLAR